MSQSLRIALLSYRTKEHSGGQGVYVRNLAAGLAELGHQVEVFSGQPYPESLDPRVALHQVPSLDLYREPDPFRIPRPSEFRDRIDLLEYATTLTAVLRRAALLQPARRPHSPRAERPPTSTSSTTTSRWATACCRSRRRLARRRDHPPPDQPRPRLALAAARWYRKPSRRPLVRLRAHAGARRPAGARHSRRVRTSPPPTPSTTSGSSGTASTSSRSASTPTCSPRRGAGGYQGASSRSPAPTRRSRGYLPARRGRQAAHRARRRAAAGMPSRARRRDRAADRRARPRRLRPASPTDSPTPSSPAARLRRGHVRALAVRRVLAADRRGAGLRNASRGQPSRGAARGARHRRRGAGPGRAGRRRGIGDPGIGGLLDSPRASAPGWAPAGRARAENRYGWLSVARATVDAYPAGDCPARRNEVADAHR